ncbi:hypothetical protein IH785_16250 [candidate division KSB1 bacterium]|nr:hypothetical protein [candidate division KSB1 bacterium]
MQNQPHSDRRRQNRRSKPTSPLTASSLFGKRKNIRRDEDSLTQPYVDLYSFSSVLGVLVTLTLSVADAIFTLKLISLGGSELNPFMDFFLQLGPIPFLTVKYILTGTCLVFFLVNENRLVFWGRLRVKLLLAFSLLLYFVLIFYELVLLAAAQ